jgi:UDP-3-O-[3-hydroxymyristoyl] N-acetylglucosamine deacetylase
MIHRKTLSRAVTFDGLGLHSGVAVHVRIEPGQNGIRFRYGSSVVAAIPENVTDTSRRTKLGDISTIEHLMSALAGLEITDVEIEVSSPELPTLGGNSSGYVLALQGVGFESLGEKEMPDIYSRLFHQEDLIKVAISKGNGHWSYDYDTRPRWPNHQRYESNEIVATYISEIAPARTFAFTEEVEPARKKGFGLGLDESSALILGEDGYVNTPSFPNEPVRHKMLDLIGDLYLAGVPISKLNVSAERSGHSSNVKAAALLYKATHS